MDTVLWVHGLACVDIRHDPETERREFHFGSNVCFKVGTPWRILAGGRIQVGDADDGQWFGLSRPVDAAARSMQLLREHTVHKFSIDPLSADVTVDFGNGILLQVFNSSSGYEGWELIDAGSTRWLVGMGGGGLAVWGAP